VWETKDEVSSLLRLVRNENPMLAIIALLL
jgi:hypothetical protein